VTTPSKPLVDQQARDRIRGDLDTTLIVEAAAGTGKTSELVERVMALLCQGKTTLARLVAVTFTEKAAGEMKLRLRTEIERARGRVGAKERARLDVALEELEEAHIGTIHGFCAELLRQRPVEARVDPLFVAADEDQQSRVFDEAFERWFQTVLADPPEGVRRVLRRKARGRQIPGSASSWTNQGGDRSGAREVLRRAGLALIQQRDFDAPWRRDPFDRNPTLDALVARLQELGNLSARAMDPDDWAAKSLKEVERFVSELLRREAVRGRDHDGLEEELRGLARGKYWGWKGRGKWFAEGKSRLEVLDLRQATKQELDRVIERADADLAACLHEDLRPLVEAYEAQKTRAGRLDFLDLLLLARNLVKSDGAVRRELQQRFTHLLVDEFQDTDPLQAELLLLLAADDPDQTQWLDARPIPGKLFVVGDPKQSIYRFRRADVTLYEATKRRLLSRGAELVHLTTSFRSTPSIQAAVNAAFAPRMQGSPDGSQAEYVALQSFRDEPVGRPSVIALPVPRPYSDFGKITGYSIDASLPDAVGAFVDWLIRTSGWTVTERERPTSRVPIEARHVCLLTRRFVNGGRDLTRDYVRALEARRIAHVLVGGRSFHAREEVVALRNALSAIEWPDDELSVFATLRGPFFALGDDALLAFRHQTGSGPHPLRPLDLTVLDELTRPVSEALEILRRLHLGRNRRATADTVAQLLDATRAHAGVAIWPTGEQALANLLRVVDQARRFEAAGATSFRAFVQWLDEESERGNAAEAPVVEEGTDGVRIMTVYKAKGLEFPVVILVDPTCPHTFQEPSRYVDGAKRLWAMPLAQCTPVELIDHREEVLRHDNDEAVRLTYVAATRARELLVVPVVGDEAYPGWVDVLHPVLYPRAVDWRRSQPAPGCPPFGADSVLLRPEGRDPEGSVAPGLHAPALGTHSVVFWDPRALELDKPEEAGLRQQRILAADETGVVAEEGSRAHAEWFARRTSLLERGAVPTFRIETVTQDRAGGSGPEIEVTLEQTDASKTQRPGGKRFGTLVHAVLAGIALDAGATQALAAAGTYGQMLGSSAEEIASAAHAVSAALRHPVMQAARAAGDACRREAPVLLLRADGALVEGALDLAYRVTGPGGVVWVIVDYKTDAELSSRRAEYEEQVRTYARAVAKATGEATRGVLLRV
jgi:ATP-dependent helicase/nuclease subunit A